MTEDTRSFIALQSQITRLSQRLRLLEKHTTIPAFGASDPKGLQSALAKKSHVIAKQDEKIKNLHNRLDELLADIARKNALIESQARTIKHQSQKIAEQDRTISVLRADRGVPVRPTRRFR